MNNQVNPSLKQHRYALRNRNQPRKFQTIPLYYVFFCVKINHEDSERLFEQVWTQMTSLKTCEMVIDGHGKLSIQLSVPCENAHLMLVKSVYTNEVTEQIIKKLLQEIQSQTLQDDMDRQHCQVIIHVQKSIDQGLLVGGPSK